MMKGVFYSWCILLCTIFGIGPVCANNVRISACNILSVSGGTATVEVGLSWDNSWRTPRNWDAVWLFMKLKGEDGTWRHVGLPDQSYSATGGFTVMNGLSGTAVTGVYIFRSAEGSGVASTKVTLQCNAGSYTKADFDSRKVFLLPQAIEMVHVPFGAYYLGDGSCTDRLAATDGMSLLVADEDGLEVRVEGAGSGTVNLGADYPKGCAGFYVMKYELTQGQYIVFLNMLTRSQQESLLGSGLAALKAGEYLFGDKAGPTSRNGIVLVKNPAGGACFFDHNLNGNKRYGEGDDGWNVACNYLSVVDLLAYASWSGLRPMNELEYESACRARAPWTPVGGEYAWNSGAGAVAVSGLNNAGRETETAANAGANVNSGNALGESAGPVRSGMFATASSGQIGAGAGYWGVMEMSGNLRDLVVGVGYTGFSRAVCGGGEFSPSLWSTTPSHYGVRGGCFAGNAGLLMVSDRSEMAYVTDCSKRDATVGGRLVLPAVAGKIDPGAIALSTPFCSPAAVITETTPASVTPNSGMTLTYVWSVKEGGGAFTVVPEEIGNTLTYNKIKENTAYQFKRKVVCSLGEAEASSSSVTSLIPVKITPHPVGLSTCIGGDFKLTVAATGSSLTYQWMKDGSPISGAKAVTYTDNSLAASDVGVYTCVVSGSCGSETSSPASVTATVGTSLKDPRDGQIYQTRVMADGREWMIEDLKFGNCDASKFSSYSEKTAQDIIAPGYYGVCIASTQPGAGYLYNWQAAMNHVNAVYNTAGNPSGNVNGNSTRQWQGICPDGWHLPSSGSTGEFQKMYDALGVVSSKIYQGTTCDGWRGVLGGLGQGSTVFVPGSQAYYWSSSFSSYTDAYSLYFFSGYVYPQYSNYKYIGSSVRCLKNY